MLTSQVAVSIVSHNQIGLVRQLLEDLRRHCRDVPICVVLTLNIAEKLPFGESDFDFPLSVIRNPFPKGFGANHNTAFNNVACEYFCVVNPDIRLADNPFPGLLALIGEGRIGLAAPLVVDPNGRIEDSVRGLPTPWRIFKKLFRKSAPDYALNSPTLEVDWVAGMFMLFPSTVFKRLGGFDERYFLYYEDVDICCRTWLQGFAVAVAPTVSVIHAARRESHSKLRYLAWHLRSMGRFFTSPVFFETLRRRARDGGDRQ